MFFVKSQPNFIYFLAYRPSNIFLSFFKNQHQKITFKSQKMGRDLCKLTKIEKSQNYESNI